MDFSFDEAESDNLYFATQFWTEDDESEDMEQGYQKLKQHSSNGRCSMEHLSTFLTELGNVSRWITPLC